MLYQSVDNNVIDYILFKHIYIYIYIYIYIQITLHITYMVNKLLLIK